MPTPSQPSRMHRRAHDISHADPERVFHCPMCGSGSVTARSDGTIECGYCATVFTVAVHPKHPGMPQTVNGQPYEPQDPAAEAEKELAEMEEYGDSAPGATAIEDEVRQAEDDEMRVLSLRQVRRMGGRLRRMS